MTAQVLFLNVFSEKDPHLNAAELTHFMNLNSLGIENNMPLQLSQKPF